MILRSFNNWKIWGSCHPSNVGCIAEGRDQCNCKYHVTDGQDIYSFDDWQEADKKFCSLTEQPSFDSLLIKKI